MFSLDFVLGFNSFQWYQDEYDNQRLGTWNLKQAIQTQPAVWVQQQSWGKMSTDYKTNNWSQNTNIHAQMFSLIRSWHGESCRCLKDDLCQLPDISHHLFHLGRRGVCYTFYSDCGSIVHLLSCHPTAVCLSVSMVMDVLASIPVRLIRSIPICYHPLPIDANVWLNVSASEHMVDL